MGIDVFDIKNQLEITKPLVKEKQQKIIIPKPKIDEMLNKFKKEFIEPVKPKKAKKPTKKLIPRHLAELEDSIITTYIETIIKQKNTQKLMRKKSIITELKSQFKISIESEEDKNRIAILSEEVGKNLGYRTTSASIMFD